jgi:hypothetical protein
LTKAANKGLSEAVDRNVARVPLSDKPKVPVSKGHIRRKDTMAKFSTDFLERREKRDGPGAIALQAMVDASHRAANADGTQTRKDLKVGGAISQSRAIQRKTIAKFAPKGRSPKELSVQEMLAGDDVARTAKHGVKSAKVGQPIIDVGGAVRRTLLSGYPFRIKVSRGYRSYICIKHGTFLKYQDWLRKSEAAHSEWEYSNDIRREERLKRKGRLKTDKLRKYIRKLETRLQQQENLLAKLRANSTINPFDGR